MSKLTGYKVMMHLMVPWIGACSIAMTYALWPVPWAQIPVGMAFIFLWIMTLRAVRRDPLLK